MLIKSIKLQNFVIFDDINISLDGVQLTTIEGRWANDRRRSNGSGKSALLECIPYALFGTTRSKSKSDVIRKGADSCKVVLEFVTNGRAVKIDRRRSKTESSAKIWVDGKLAASQNRNVDAMVQQVVGLDRDLFELIYFFRQDDQFGFVNASPGDRKSYLSKVFDLSAVDACLSEARVRHKAAVEANLRAQGQRDALHQQLGHVPPLGALESDLLDAYDDLSLYEVSKRSHDDYARICKFDISYARKAIDDYDRETTQRIQRCKDLREQIQQAINKCNRSKVAISRNQSVQDSHKSDLKALPSYDEEMPDRAVLEQALEACISAETEVTKEIAVCSHVISSGKKIITNTQSIVGSKCPTCYQIVGVDHVESLAKKVEQSVRDSDAKHKALGARLAQRKIDVKNARGKLDDLTKRVRDEARAVELKGMINDLGRITQPMVRELDELEIAIGKWQQELADVSADSNVQGGARKRADLIKIIDRFEASLEQADLPVDMAQATSQASSCETSIRQYRDLQGQVEEADSNLDVTARDVEIASKLMDVFGKNGLQAILIENVISVIEQFANNILKQMQTRFTISFKTQKQTQAGEARETLDIIVYDNGEERTFETYSGGERTLINLAVRLSLSRIVSSLHGIVVQSLFLDEVLASLDEVNREEAIKVVAFLAKSFEQVFVISHTNEVRDVVASNILVERYADYSEVVITNGRAQAQGS